MRSWTRRWGACGIAVAAALAGCGGNVVVDGEADGGGGEGGGVKSGGDEGGTTSTTPTGTTTSTTSWTTTTTTSWTTTSTTTVTIDPGDVTPACLAYCDAIADHGCFTVEDCQVRCMGYYVAGCVSELEAVLACLPSSLNPFCQITYPPDGEGCDPVLVKLEVCRAATYGECGGQAGLIGDSACHGKANCPDGGELQVFCDASGLCTCTQDGSEVGTCGMPFTGTEPCTASLTCCRAFL